MLGGKTAFFGFNKGANQANRVLHLFRTVNCFLMRKLAHC